MVTHGWWSISAADNRSVAERTKIYDRAATSKNHHTRPDSECENHHRWRREKKRLIDELRNWYIVRLIASLIVWLMNECADRQIDRQTNIHQHTPQRGPTLDIKSCASADMRNSSIFRLSYRDALMLAYNSFRSMPSGAANASSPVGGLGLGLVKVR